MKILSERVDLTVEDKKGKKWGNYPLGILLVDSFSEKGKEKIIYLRTSIGPMVIWNDNDPARTPIGTITGLDCFFPYEGEIRLRNKK